MTTHHINDFTDLAHRYERGWPWQVIGVFPVASTEGPSHAWWNSFCYTSGLGKMELWVPVCSIEGRCAGFDLTGSMLNFIAAAWADLQLTFGDNIVIPLGVPDADDIDTIWWIGNDPEPARKRQCFQTVADVCVPILWSSGLGWKDDDD